MCACSNIRHYWPCGYSIDNPYGSGTGCSSCSHAVEYTNEEGLEDPSFWASVFRIYVRLRNLRGDHPLT